ncbi:MAG: KAP family NTPase [Comamonadaceae bacterium]|nr:KAP family NTPase [Comamonadaceae bacterium]
MLEQARRRSFAVLVDDLDRCLPNTAIATLEAMRLLLHAPPVRPSSSLPTNK